jgi:hypothetical protein
LGSNKIFSNILARTLKNIIQQTYTYHVSSQTFRIIYPGLIIMEKKHTTKGRESPSDGNGISSKEGRQRLAQALFRMKPESERIEAISSISIPKLIKVVRDITNELGIEKLPDAIEAEIIENILLVEPDQRFEILSVMIQRHFDEASENSQRHQNGESACPGCSVRNPGDMKRRSTDLDPASSPDPHETLKLIERGKLALVYREFADEAGSGSEVGGDNCPKCTQRTATPTADEYASVRVDIHGIEGRRSIELDPESDQTPEENFIQIEGIMKEEGD